MNKKLMLLLLAAALVPVAAPAQTRPAAAPAQANVEVDPIRCWWRSSTGAVHVGETFSVVLTCAALQNDAVQVTPDETRLDSAVVQMAPFEVIGGAHPADLYSGNRRFFQYEYTLRIINPDPIGKDVKIPDPGIHYRINSSVSANAASEGREHLYILPPLSMRVISLVPADAPDIRDASKDSFASAEQLGFRANVLQIIAVTALALGALIACIAVARLLMRVRKTKRVGRRGLAEASVLGVAARELNAVRRDSAGQGWNEGLVARALAAARIAAAGALGRPLSQRPAAGVEAGEGRLITRVGWRRTPTIVSAAGTPEDLARAIEKLSPAAGPARRQMLEDLHAALGTFTSVLYSREASLEQGALDEALGRAIAATRRVRSDRLWFKTYFRRWVTLEAQQQA